VLGRAGSGRSRPLARCPRRTASEPGRRQQPRFDQFLHCPGARAAGHVSALAGQFRHGLDRCGAPGDQAHPVVDAVGRAEGALGDQPVDQRAPVRAGVLGRFSGIQVDPLPIGEVLLELGRPVVGVLVVALHGRQCQELVSVKPAVLVLRTSDGSVQRVGQSEQAFP